MTPVILSKEQLTMMQPSPQDSKVGRSHVEGWTIASKKMEEEAAAKTVVDGAAGGAEAKEEPA